MDVRYFVMIVILVITGIIGVNLYQLRNDNKDVPPPVSWMQEHYSSVKEYKGHTKLVTISHDGKIYTTTKLSEADVKRPCLECHINKK